MYIDFSLYFDIDIYTECINTLLMKVFVRLCTLNDGDDYGCDISRCSPARDHLSFRTVTCSVFADKNTISTQALNPEP